MIEGAVAQRSEQPEGDFQRDIGIGRKVDDERDQRACEGVHGHVVLGREGEGALYCQCTDPTTGETVPDTPPACQTP